VNSFISIDGEFSIKKEIKRSVFIATVRGGLDYEGAEEFVRGIKKRYPDATHNCYAYIADELGNRTRFSDDGEPSGTAGQPILDVLRKRGLRKTAVVVTRYFGGIKLGAGGLVGAYSGAAAEAIAAAKIVRSIEAEKLKITADYSDFAMLEKLARRNNLLFENTEYGDEVEAFLSVKADDAENIISAICEATAGRTRVETVDGKFFVRE